jgi:hypothetical protein
MTSAALLELTRTELATRVDNGVTVTLFWSRETNVVTVTVEDPANCDYFELVLADNEPPLEVFHHPYAYAAARGLEFGRSETYLGDEVVFVDV